MRGSDINIDITRKCTLKCRHCYNHSGEMNNDELASDELFRIMNDLASTRPDNFCICGGEPLLKKEIIFRFIDHQKKISASTSRSRRATCSIPDVLQAAVLSTSTTIS